MRVARLSGLLLSLSLSLIVGLLACSTAKSQKELERDWAHDLTPTGFATEDSTRAIGLAPRKLKIRLWADEEYRRTTVGWQIRAYRQIAGASEFLEERFRTSLEVVEAKDWDRSSRLTGGTLDADLLALEQHDPGNDVDLVIGLVTPLPIASSVMHQLGMARMLGRHAVMRGMDDLVEAKFLAEGLQHISEEERAEVYRRRLRHKEVAVLLHELGHLFGLLHVADERSLMNPNYNALEIGFDGASMELLAIGLRDAGPARFKQMSSTRAALAKAMQASTDASWDRRERADAIRWLGDQGPPPSSLGGAAIDDSGRIKQALEKSRAGDHAGAWALIASQLEESPKDPQLAGLACELRTRADPRSKQAIESCVAAAALRPADPLPSFSVAFCRLEQNDPAGALHDLTESERRLAAIQPAHPEAWAMLASAYLRAGAISAAERAAKSAGDEETSREVVQSAARTRQRYGLAADKVPEEREGEYLRLRTELDAVAGSGRLADAERIMNALKAGFPKADAGELALCEAAAEAKSLKRADLYCRRAAASAPRNPRPVVVLGFVALAWGRVKVAIDELNRALALAPSDKQVWRLLLAAYQLSGRSDALADLRRRYQSAFGEALQP